MSMVAVGRLTWQVPYQPTPVVPQRRNVDSTREPASLDERAKLARRQEADLLLDQHWEVLCRYASSRVRDQPAAEDLVQETLLAAVRDQARFRDESSVRTWLVGILRHKIADYWRRLQRDGSTESDQAVDSLFDERGTWRGIPGRWMPDPSQLSENEDFWSVVDQCLDQLPAQARSVFAMRVIDGVSSEGVCQALEISSTNLWVLLHRARLRLRTCLAKRWFSTEQSGRT